MGRLLLRFFAFLSLLIRFSRFSNIDLSGVDYSEEDTADENDI